MNKKKRGAILLGLGLLVTFVLLTLQDTVGVEMAVAAPIAAGAFVFEIVGVIMIVSKTKTK